MNKIFGCILQILEFYEYYKLIMFSSFWLEKFRVRKSVNSVTWHPTSKNLIGN